MRQSTSTIKFQTYEEMRIPKAMRPNIGHRERNW